MGERPGSESNGAGASPAAIIFLNGASSAGKSTLARGLQAQLPQPFWHFSIDHLRDAGVLPLERFHSGEFSWREHRAAFFEGFHRSLPVLAAAGNNLIVEHIVETPAWMRQLVALLAPFDTFFVGVHCRVSVLEQRERARGDRPLGDARRDAVNVHNHALYDLELDTAARPSKLVDQLHRAWEQRSSPSAFQQMQINGLPKI